MIALLLLALALAMDAVVVSTARGAGGPHAWRPALETGLTFGGVQALMALLGWAVGVVFAGMTEAYDHWIAFGLLGALGLRLIWLALGDDGGAEARAVTSGSTAATRQADYWHVLGLAAVATSIDAAAAGLGLAAYYFFTG